MKIETLKSRKRKYFLYVLIVGVVLLLMINLTTTKAKYKTTESIPLAKGTITYELGDLNIIAMFSKNDSGIYEEISTMPTSGYHINSNETYCKVNGEVDKEIEVEVINNKVYVSNVKEKTKCYLYFDKNTCGSACEKILADNPIKAVRTNFDQPLTTNTTGTLFQASDDDGISYYYAGAVDNNWVKFGGFYWRIIRINGDGSIRMIYSGSEESGPVTTGEATQIGTSAFNENYNDNAYVGYMYGTPGSSTYEETHANINDSSIKLYLDNWYESNLVSYENYIDTNAGFCGDRENSRTMDGVLDGTGGTGTTITYYAPKYRLHINKAPTLKCANSSDLYTLANSSKGNKVLSKPIGLITADEVAYAGSVHDVANLNYYLYTGKYYWLISAYMLGYNGLSYVSFLYDNGAHAGAVTNNQFGIRPVINLKANTQFVDGSTGTTSNPYAII